MIKEYKPLKIPSGMTEGYIFSIASSRQLNIFGEQVGIKRRRFLFIKEPDFLFKNRIRNRGIQLKRSEKDAEKL
ncbi:hypothetical protein [Rossellomorea marisflavi]|uniref:hypothetical protein n=1 Tax=Rossellomorea marisflavi TaxID=189381 RepID=UPI00345DCDEE